MSDKYLGAFLGVAIGDAAGSYLEFTKDPTPDQVHKAMTMPGGGPHRLGPGQITDDTELALALADGLLRGRSTKSSTIFPADTIANEYVKWMQTGPFDIGYTCRMAFGIKPGPNAAGRMMHEASLRSGSKANGALMRCIPICLFTAKNLRDTIDYARRDAALSHQNPTCQNANVAYCAAVAHLLECPKDTQGAMAKAAATSMTVALCEDDVASWISLDTLADASVNEGFVKHAFSMAFWHLKRGTDFETAIRETIAKGGDTDTNAAIVGGMMGAYHGAEAIPSYLVDPVVAGLNPRPRPMAYRASRIPDIVNKLYCTSSSS